MKNLHPRGLYLGSKSRTRKAVDGRPAGESSVPKGRKLNFDQANSTAHLVNKSQSSETGPSGHNVDGDYTAQDMLVQDGGANRQRDLSEEAGSESSSRLIKQNFNYFQGQPGSSSLDASPITK